MVSNNILTFPGFFPSQAGRRIIPSRLKDARKAKRMTQEELGAHAEVSRQAISAYESGEKNPDPMTFTKMAAVLGQPTVFFTCEDRPVFGRCGTRFFRKTGPETIRRNDSCSILGQWFVQTTRYLDDFINYPEVDLLSASTNNPSGRYSFDEIEEVAADCRRRWGLGLGPISNVLALLESKGVAVCRYDMENERIDAFSFWNGERPFIFMACEKESGARVRFDLAHELGHLILHKWIEPEEVQDPKQLKIIEAEADRFAGAFLLPSKSFPNEVYTARLDAFLDLKRRWAVSIQAMIYRCKDLELIDESQFTNLYKSISYRKWRTKEPLDDPTIIRVEQPRLLKRAMEMLLESEKRHADEICAEIALEPRLIEAFCNLPAGTLTPRSLYKSEPSLK